MRETSQPEQTLNSTNALTRASLDELLRALDVDREHAGAKYTELRAQLARFFTWRGCPYPEDHADETLNRVARRVSEGEPIDDLRHYVFGVARLIVFEVQKQEARKRLALAELPIPDDAVSDEDEEVSRARLGCLTKCMNQLSPENRLLIVEYYQCERAEKIANRKRLAARLNLTASTLRMRALRLRENLETCLGDCMGEAGM